MRCYSLALFSPSCQLHHLLILVIYLQRNSGHAFLGMNDQDQSLPETGGGDSFRGVIMGAFDNFPRGGKFVNTPLQKCASQYPNGLLPITQNHKLVIWVRGCSKIDYR